MLDQSPWLHLVLRMVVATLAGAALGWERSRQDRAIMGLRTLSLVALASCIAVLSIVHSDLPQMNADAAGRVVQGVLSGGRLHRRGRAPAREQGSAGPRSRDRSQHLGVGGDGRGGGLAVWPLIAGGTALGLLVLLLGAPLERHIRDNARRSSGEADRRAIEEQP